MFEIPMIAVLRWLKEAVIGGAFMAINLFFPDSKKAEGMEINGSIEKS
jgi:hypothetical protein